MGNGIFRRLFLTNIAIVVGVLLAVAIASTLFTNWYFQRQEQRQLEAQGKVVSRLLADYLSGQAAVKEVQQVVDALAGTTSTRIVALQARPDMSAHLQQSLGKIRDAQDIARIYSQVLKGQQVVEHRSFFFPYKTSAVLVGMPVMVDGTVQAVVFLYTPLTESAETLKGFYRIIWGAALGAFLVAAMIIYAVSRRLVRPITEMAAGARALSQGNMVPDFPVDNNDEISDLAAAFNQMKAEISNTEQIRRDLITDVSHELRTPLTSVRGFIQAILDGIVAPEQERKYLGLAYDELKRVIALVQDLLDLSRLQAGTTVVEQERVNLNQVVEKVVAMLELQAASHGISLRIEAEEPVLVTGDENRLGQIVINLLQNALSYSPDGAEVLLKLSTDSSQAVLAVRDQGAGIKDEDLPYIFDRFKRGANSVSGGTGVGLAIVKALVELHGGSLQAESEPGAGTEIRVLLPSLQMVNK